MTQSNNRFGAYATRFAGSFVFNPASTLITADYEYISHVPPGRYIFTFAKYTETELVDLHLPIEMPARNSWSIGTPSQSYYNRFLELATAPEVAYQIQPFNIINDGFAGTESDNSVQGFRLTYTYNFNNDPVFPNGSRLRFSVLIRPILRNIKRIQSPTYLDLVSGYELDSRVKATKLTIQSSTDKKIQIGYYQQNTLEKYSKELPDFFRNSSAGTSSKVKRTLTTIDWRQVEIELKKDIPFIVDCEDIVIGTLWADDNNISITPDGTYQLEYLQYNPSKTQELYAYWLTLWNAYANNEPLRIAQALMPSPTLTTDTGQFGDIVQVTGLATLRISRAFNNYWDNVTLDLDDLNFDDTKPLFKVEDIETYDNYFKPQNDGSYGDLEMDSPRIIETNDLVKQLGKAFDVNTYSKMPTSNDMRVWNLGKIIYESARVLGLRRKPDGTIDRQLEQKTYLRKIKNNPIYKKDDYSTTCMGDYGRLTPHLTNQNGKDAYDVSYDLFQFLESLMEHLNRSLGVQQGTEIRIKNPTTGKEDYYPNQLALLLEIYNKLAKIELDSKESFNLVSIATNSIFELFSGIGIPVTFKRLFNRYGDFTYVGHQFDKGSIQTSLGTLKINIAMILGNMLNSKADNPLMKFIRKVK